MQINMLAAKNQLSRLVAAAQRGEEVILARDGKPVAKLVKYDAPRVKPPGVWQSTVPYCDTWRSPETDALVDALFHGDSQ